MVDEIKQVDPVPGIGVGAIVFDGDSVLLIKRDKPPAMGQWSVPGGKLEPGESLCDACIREVMEETGLFVKAGNIVAVVERRVESFHYVIVDFIAFIPEAGSKVPCASSDVCEALWVKVNQICQYNLVEGLERIINKAYDEVSRGQMNGLADVDGQGLDFI